MFEKIKRWLTILFKWGSESKIVKTLQKEQKNTETPPLKEVIIDFAKEEVKQEVNVVIEKAVNAIKKRASKKVKEDGN